MEKIPKYYVYIITNTLNKKQYVGSKICYIENPLDDEYLGSSEYLSKDILLSGKENFKKEILQSDYKNYKEALEGETFYILKYNTLEPNGYNRFLPNKRYGFNTTGISIFEIWKLKYGEQIAIEKYNLWKERERKAQLGNKNSFYGKQHTEKTKDQIRKKQTGKRFSEEINKKKSSPHFGDKNGMHGRMWITNGIKDKVILKTELNTYLNDGWQKGRIKKS